MTLPTPRETRRGENAAETRYVDVAALRGDRSVDHLFEVLGNRRRRYVLYALLDGTGSAGVRALSDGLARYESGASQESVDDDKHQSVYISLYQTHLPKLDDAGIVEYDRDDASVRLTPRVAGAVSVERDGDTADRAAAYALLACAGTVGLALDLTVGAPLGPIAVVVTVAVAALAARDALTGRAGVPEHRRIELHEFV